MFSAAGVTTGKSLHPEGITIRTVSRWVQRNGFFQNCFHTDDLVVFLQTRDKSLCLVFEHTPCGLCVCRTAGCLWTSVSLSPRFCLSVTTPAPAGGPAGTVWFRTGWGDVGSSSSSETDGCRFTVKLLLHSSQWENTSFYRICFIGKKFRDDQCFFFFF